MMIYQFLGLPAQIPYNDCHDYILRHRKPAKGGNPRWEPIDLGGGDAKLVDTLAKHTTEKDKKSVW
ncbi:MAG: hypothetical protein K0Q74_1547, partial [Gammaproteobacteria bacterium]|nr:hypothetical protein [Gammaproteobacteria bacterium]